MGISLFIRFHSRCGFYIGFLSAGISVQSQVRVGSLVSSWMLACKDCQPVWLTCLLASCRSDWFVSHLAYSWGFGLASWLVLWLMLVYLSGFVFHSRCGFFFGYLSVGLSM